MEAEWEYAARAGTTGATPEGELTALDCSDTTLTELGWFCGNSDTKTHPVAQLQPNPWGLYDMLGNVSEWVWDPEYDYPDAPVTDPHYREESAARGIRGGVFSSDARWCRSGAREYDMAYERTKPYGLRVARTAR